MTKEETRIQMCCHARKIGGTRFFDGEWINPELNPKFVCGLIHESSPDSILLRICKNPYNVNCCEYEQEEKPFGYCPSCMVYVLTKDGNKCPNCNSETIKKEDFTEAEYQRIRKEKGLEGVISFWYSYHAITESEPLFVLPGESD